MIVVGLGAMGSAAAYHLTLRGMRVLGIDTHQPPHQRGSHHGESRIIRKAYYEHPAYVPLLERAFASWAEVAERAGAPLLAKTGGLMIGTHAGQLVPGVLASVRAHRLAHEVLSGEQLMARYPPLRVDAEMTGVWEADAGILFPERCIRTFLAGAAAAHAELRYGEPAVAWTGARDGVRVQTARDEYQAAALVLTAGAGMRDLIPDLHAYLQVERQVVAHFAPIGSHDLLTQERFPIFCVEEADGAFYYGLPDLGSGCKVGRHHAGAIGAPDTLLAQAVTASDIADLRGFLARRLPQADGAPLAAAVCLYTNTPDFHFIIDRHPRHDNVIIASVCSGHGFKFATVVGEIVADLASARTPSFDLSMFRLARLSPGGARA